MNLSKESSAVDKVLTCLSADKSNIIPILQAVQNELGYLPKHAIERISSFTKISESEIYGVSTFYAQFRFTPIGKHLITVCRGTACHVRGSARILNELEKNIGIESGSTSEDLLFTLETVACLGSCALAPVMVIDGRVYGGLTTTKANALVDEFRKQEKKYNSSGKKKKVKSRSKAARK